MCTENVLTPPAGVQEVSSRYCLKGSSYFKINKKAQQVALEDERGISKKPKPMELRRAWLREFTALDSRGCRNKPICLIRETRFVYWGGKFWS